MPAVCVVNFHGDLVSSQEEFESQYETKIHQKHQYKHSGEIKSLSVPEIPASLVHTWN